PRNISFNNEPGHELFSSLGKVSGRYRRRDPCRQRVRCSDKQSSIEPPSPGAVRKWIELTLDIGIESEETTVVQMHPTAISCRTALSHPYRELIYCQDATALACLADSETHFEMHSGTHSIFPGPAMRSQEQDRH